MASPAGLSIVRGPLVRVVVEEKTLLFVTCLAGPAGQEQIGTSGSWFKWCLWGHRNDFHSCQTCKQIPSLLDVPVQF